MAPLLAGPCEAWDPLCPKSELDDLSPEDRADILMAATEALWSRTKRRFGFCSFTLRPCRKECFPAWQHSPIPGWNDVTGWSWPFPALIGGMWFNLACGSCPGTCSCSRISETTLPYPVAEITQVKVDGSVLPPTAYRVDDFRLLVRLGGEEWPRCNDLNLNDDQEGTWSVTASYGEPVPQLGRLAVGELGTQLAKVCVGAADCQLPIATVQRVTRQGVTKVFFDANTAFKSGRIGLYHSDLFISTENPTATGRATVFPIDGHRNRRVGT